MRSSLISSVPSSADRLDSVVMYSIEMEALKGTPCACGELSFERVVIEREGREPYLTDFIACVFCPSCVPGAHVRCGGAGGSPAQRGVPRAALVHEIWEAEKTVIAAQRRTHPPCL